MMDAGNCFKKVSAPDAINAFRGAISNWCEAGRFNQAAKLTKEIAEMYEKDNWKECPSRIRLQLAR